MPPTSTRFRPSRGARPSAGGRADSPASAGCVGAGRDRGFALLLVLWSLVLLTLLATRLVAAGRGEAQLAANLRDAAVVEAAADGAVYEAVFHLMGHGGAWPPRGRHQVRVGGATVEVVVEDLSGRVNPNAASTELLQALLRGVGGDPRLADAIMDWRTPGQVPRPFGAKAGEYRAAGRPYGPPGTPFRSVDEVGLVLGMTPALLDRLRPHLTVWWDGDPDPAAADPVVQAALRATGAGEGGGSGSVLVLAVTAEASGAHGSRFVRRAVVQVAAGGTGGSRWQVLDWRSAAR